MVMEFSFLFRCPAEDAFRCPAEGALRWAPFLCGQKWGKEPTKGTALCKPTRDGCLVLWCAPLIVLTRRRPVHSVPGGERCRLYFQCPTVGGP